ncbi:MAG: 4-vinyl reductase [Ardenticatenaceae bacterium]|nr:4-vinyl reductase [Ardenticatenaceae bacterium]
MNIQNKADHDPVTDMYTVDAYLRWALMAAEEVVGEKGMHIVLREARLEKLVGNYPPNESKVIGNYTFADYANLCTALLTFFGRAGRSMTLRIGRKSAELAVEQQSATFGLGTLVKASRILPITQQLKAGLLMMQNGLKKLSQEVGQERLVRLEDGGDVFRYIDETCPYCAGKTADSPICWVHNGVILQAAVWLTGKEFDVQETECRAMGAPACIWEVSKKPKA